LNLDREFFHRFIEDLTIQIKTDGVHRAGLFFAQNVARAADLKVALSDEIARAQFRGFLERFKAFFCIFGKDF